MNSFPTFFKILILIALFLLPACVGVEQSVPRPAMPVFPEPAQSGTIPSTVVTLLPASTHTPADPTLTFSPTPQPEGSQAAPEIAMALTPDAPPSQPWQDCSLAGGWTGCDSSAPALAARLAFFNPAGPAVIALDLAGPSGWSVPSALSAADPRMRWSPGAAYLLVAQDESQMAVYAADGTPLGSLALAQDEAPPAWQPNGELAAAETIQSAPGAQAHLEQGTDLRWQVVFQSAPGAEAQRLNLETEPTDRLYRLISFVPGTNLVLGQTYFAGNQAMMQGGQLFTFDLLTGERRDLEAMAPLGWQASYAWQETGPAGQPTRLAFADTGGPQIGLPTLTLLDFSAASLERPLPQGVAVADLAWQPQAGGLAFAASPAGEIAPASAAGLYSLPAIYLLSPATDEVRALTQPPAGARDGLPTWTGDGQSLLYARYFESGVLEVHAVQADGSGDRLIVSGVPGECPSEGPGCPWGRWIAISAR